MLNRPFRFSDFLKFILIISVNYFLPPFCNDFNTIVIVNSFVPYIINKSCKVLVKNFNEINNNNNNNNNNDNNNNCIGLIKILY